MQKKKKTKKKEKEEKTSKNLERMKERNKNTYQNASLTRSAQELLLQYIF